MLAIQQLEMFALTPEEINQNEVTEIKVQLVKLRKSHFAAKTELLQLIVEMRSEIDSLKKIFNKS